MPIELAEPRADLMMPMPTGEDWHQHKIHTHYFGFSVPEERMFIFTYLRAHPAFPLAQGGVCIFQGLDNADLLDILHLDYQMTMPWPTLEGNTIATDNGLVIEFPEPGKTARLRYTATNGNATFDVRLDAVTPLFARSFIMPGEPDFHVGDADSPTDLERSHGGMEQYMHITGELDVHGREYAVDCHHPRDRSWNQVRVEKEGPMPPTGWTPMRFGDDLTLNLTSSECASTNPLWADLYEPKTEESCITFGWIHSVGEETARAITWARRNVLAYHPQNHMVTRQEIEVRDEVGNSYRFSGEAIATASIPQWPNLAYRVSLYRWEDESGRECFGDFQEMWFSPFHQLLRERITTSTGCGTTSQTSDSQAVK